MPKIDYNALWAEWIVKSVRKFVDDRRQDLIIHYTEDKPKKDLVDWAEFRINGPDSQRLGFSLWELKISINFVITVNSHEQNRDLIYTNTGLIASFYRDAIPVYKHGADESLLGCLVLDTDKKEAVRINHFGKPDPNVSYLQATVEGDYKILLP